MAASPLISIITPTYNVSGIVEKSIRSIVDQTYKNIEYIVVDGGSSDGTLEIFEKYRAGISTLIVEPDQGIYDAINKGIARAKGEWIYIIGADDYLADESVIENLFANDLSQYDVVYGNVYYGLSKQVFDGEFDIAKILDHNICHQGIFTKRKLFDKYGTFDLKYKAKADYAFNLQWFGDRSTKIKYVDNIIAVYEGSGFSSQVPDHNFFTDQADLFTRYLNISTFSKEMIPVHRWMFRYFLKRKKYILGIKHLLILAMAERKFFTYFRKGIVKTFKRG